MNLTDLDRMVYESVFPPEDANVFVQLMAVFRDQDARLKREGKETVIEAYKRSKKAQENQALQRVESGYARAEIVCALMLFAILLMTVEAFCASL